MIVFSATGSQSNSRQKIGEMPVKGTMLVYRPDSPRPDVAEYDTEKGHKDINIAVGGYFELVPGFDTIVRDGEVCPCAAFCNEDGKNIGLHWNHSANVLWDRALERRGASRFDEHGQPKDCLVGTIAVVYGSPEFMSALSRRRNGWPVKGSA